ncbi:MAG: hypothetical protein LQ342_005943 [Letrouitia transgressa]|nr:MAG: hypothetical protein LQ342_005943 [Letrouitia transgressa]
MAGFIPYPHEVENLQFERKNIIVKLPNIASLWSTIYYRHDVCTGLSTCLVIGTHSDWFEKSLQQVFPSHGPPLRRDPFAILTSTAAEWSAILEEERYYRDRETQAEEGKTGLAPIIVNPSMRIEKFGINSTQGLHSVATHLHFFERGLSFQCACISWLLEQHKSLIALRRHAVQAQGKPAWSLSDGASAEKTRRSLDLGLSFANNRHKQVLELVYRITTQVKIVDNMIAQDDSHTNIAIAEQSRKIAIETKRDSVAMKTIAALTMAFLPGTFVGVWRFIYSLDISDNK